MLVINCVLVDHTISLNLLFAAFNFDFLVLQRHYIDPVHEDILIEGLADATLTTARRALRVQRCWRFELGASQ